MKIKVLHTAQSNGKSIKLKQIWREGQYAIFQEIGSDQNFEVIRIKQRKPNLAWKGEEEYDLIESYPSAESWGLNGFTCCSLERAQAKVKAMREGEAVALSEAAIRDEGAKNVE